MWNEDQKRRESDHSPFGICYALITALMMVFSAHTALAQGLPAQFVDAAAMVVAVALANKMARIAWALLVKGGPYRARAPVAAA